MNNENNENNGTNNGTNNDFATDLYDLLTETTAKFGLPSFVTSAVIAVLNTADVTNVDIEHLGAWAASSLMAWVFGHKHNKER